MMFGTEEDVGSIEQGTIGWGNDPTVLDFGSDTNDGLALFRVTLTRGRTRTEANETRAKGQEVLCRWGIIVDWVPPAGTQCVVAFPAGLRGTSGAGVIIGIVKSNASQFKTNRAVLNLGSGVHVLLKGKSVTLSDYNSPARYLTVGSSYAGGPSGLMAQDETGSGWTVQAGAVGIFAASGGPPDAKALIQMTSSKIEILHKSAGIVRFKDDQITILANKEAFVMGTKVGLGGSTLATLPPGVGAIYGLSGPSGVASTSVFISP